MEWNRKEMESILLKSSSSADLELIQILAKKLGITVEKIIDTLDNSSPKKEDIKLNHDFFKSEGIWKDRKIDASSLRNEAWKIQN